MLHNYKTQGNNSVVLIYQAIIQNQEQTREQELGSRERLQLNKQWYVLRSCSNRILEMGIVPNSQGRWCVVCAPAIWQTVFWQPHTLAHIGVRTTLNRILLTWYWPGITADIRRLVSSCEVRQTARNGGVTGTNNRQRLYAKRPWQKMAIDLVGPPSRKRKKTQMDTGTYRQFYPLAGFLGENQRYFPSGRQCFPTSDCWSKYTFTRVLGRGTAPDKTMLVVKSMKHLHYSLPPLVKGDYGKTQSPVRGLLDNTPRKKRTGRVGPPTSTTDESIPCHPLFCNWTDG